jgi:uncharacterized damage-inducible protein DinB
MKTRFINAFRGNTLYLLNMLKGLTDEDMLLCTGESNTIGWILGHIIRYRGTILQKMNKEIEIKDFEKNFERGAKKNKELKINYEEAINNFSSRGDKIVTALSDMDDEAFKQNIGMELPDGKNDLESLLSFLSWHETFHLGQIDLIKAAVGKGGIK